jgi:hypothetical protein
MALTNRFLETGVTGKRSSGCGFHELQHTVVVAMTVIGMV